VLRGYSIVESTSFPALPCDVLIEDRLKAIAPVVSTDFRGISLASAQCASPQQHRARAARVGRLDQWQRSLPTILLFHL
jgi:hypothetical protein